MIRFYANENLSAVLVNHLRSLGHDVLTSYDAGNANQCIPDDRVLATAMADGRCVITFNRKDFLALHRSGVEHAGILICKDDRDRIQQAQIIHEELGEESSLRNRFFRVLKRNQLGLNQPLLILQEYSRSSD
jgi:predicted nuclease of predicted toxin-antitoxin system